MLYVLLYKQSNLGNTNNLVCNDYCMRPQKSMDKMEQLFYWNRIKILGHESWSK